MLEHGRSHQEVARSDNPLDELSRVVQAGGVGSEGGVVELHRVDEGSDWDVVQVVHGVASEGSSNLGAQHAAQAKKGLK